MKSALSFGAGVQTTALLVLIAEGRWPRPDAIVFADTGQEHVETYTYMAEVSGPYARKHDLPIVVLGSEWRTNHYAADLETYCLEHRMLPGTWVRWCTDRYKVRPIHRYHKRVMGATAANPVESWIGISTNEAKRARPSAVPYEVKRYPLIEMVISRDQCEDIIASAGLPVPPKSGCWFCPFMKQSSWRALKRRDPEKFGRALALESNARGADGSSKYLPMFGPLTTIAAQDELPGFDAAIEDEGGCVTGNCFV